MKEEKKEQEVVTNQVTDTEIQDGELDKVNGGGLHAPFFFGRSDKSLSKIISNGQSSAMCSM